MGALAIHGGRRLDGALGASGSKNAALPMMAAAILADGPVELPGTPRLSDVETLAAVLATLGVRTERRETGLRAEVVDPRPVRAEFELVARMRAAVCVLGPLVARRGRAEIALPGGCNLGPRPIDIHLRGLAALGATVERSDDYIVVRAGRLRGAAVDLAGPRGSTVTGTANLLCAASLAEGESRLEHAACEPEIVQLGRLLTAMGARIEGLGTPIIRVRGVDSLKGATCPVGPDRIEAATLLLAAAITRGRLRLSNTRPAEMTAVLDALRASGVRLDIAGDEVRLDAMSHPLRAVDVVAEPYPGFPTDLQAPWTALLATAEGESRVIDRVFPERFSHLAELARMGADLAPLAGGVRVRGVRRLRGASLRATDLRAGAAMVLAALAAAGQTLLDEFEHLDRGYQRLDEKLRTLGADVRRLPTGV